MAYLFFVTRSLNYLFLPMKQGMQAQELISSFLMTLIKGKSKNTNELTLRWKCRRASILRTNGGAKRTSFLKQREYSVTTNKRECTALPLPFPYSNMQ